MQKDNTKKKNTKRDIGIALLIFQCLAIYGATLNENGFPTNIPGWIGFFCFAILGITLIISDINKKK